MRVTKVRKYGTIKPNAVFGGGRGGLCFKMKSVIKATAGLLVLILLGYVALGCLVYGYYEPSIKSLMADVNAESSRQRGWEEALTEIEEECRRLEAVQNNALSVQWKQKDRLQQAVKNEEIRNSLLRKSIKDEKLQSAVEWKLRTEARLEQAQQALAKFEGPKKDAKVEAKIQTLRQKLGALRVRRQVFQTMQDRLNLMIEWRDRLKIWPLPLIDRFVEKEEPPAEK